MERVRIYQIPINCAVNYKFLCDTRCDTFLYKRLLSGCVAFCKVAVVLGIEFEKNTLYTSLDQWLHKAKNEVAHRCRSNMETILVESA